MISKRTIIEIPIGIEYTSVPSTEPPSYWQKLLNNPPGFYRPFTRREARERAEDWDTCAVSEFTGFDRNGYAPCDEELYQLGMRFHESVDAANWEAARKIYEHITERVQELGGRRHSNALGQLS